MDILGLSYFLLILSIWFFGIWRAHAERATHIPRRPR